MESCRASGRRGACLAGVPGRRGACLACVTLNARVGFARYQIISYKGMQIMYQRIVGKSPCTQQLKLQVHGPEGMPKRCGHVKVLEVAFELFV